jgi:phage host-nuclease inhibitor protein Gam
MASAAPKRIKAPAVANVAQTREQTAAEIKHLGDVQRMLGRELADMNDTIAEITKAHQPALEALTAEIEALQASIQGWCEANRDDLTNGGKVKTANLVTGEVQWRQRPPSVRVRAAEMVIDTLLKLGLDRFVRVKTEINKEAMLADPEGVSGIAGIAIQTGVEDFVITPFEQVAP